MDNLGNVVDQVQMALGDKVFTFITVAVLLFLTFAIIKFVKKRVLKPIIILGLAWLLVTTSLGATLITKVNPIMEMFRNLFN